MNAGSSCTPATGKADIVYPAGFDNISRKVISAQQRAFLIAADCEVTFDNLTRQLYATDASIYQIEPEGVAFPRNAQQASSVIRAAVDAGIAIIPRGAGSG